MDASQILKKLMDSQGVKTSTLSKETGITYTTIDSILKGGSRQPRDETLKPMAKYFSVTLDQIKGYQPIEDFGDWNSPGERRLANLLPVFPNATDLLWYWLKGELSRADIPHFHRTAYTYGPRAFAINSPDDAVAPLITLGQIAFVDPDAPEERITSPGVALVNKNGNYSFRDVVNDLGETKYTARSTHFSTLTSDECTVTGYLVGIPETNWSELTLEEIRDGEHISKFF